MLNVKRPCGFGYSERGVRYCERCEDLVVCDSSKGGTSPCER